MFTVYEMINANKTMTYNAVLSSNYATRGLSTLTLLKRHFNHIQYIDKALFHLIEYYRLRKRV